MKNIEVKIKILRQLPFNPVPEPSTSGSAGLDLIAAQDKEYIIKPGERAAIPSGIAIALPEGFEAQIRPRSGLALYHGITVLNSPGTIDQDYRGEIIIILINHSHENYTIKPGERIAQMIISQYTPIQWKIVLNLSETKRNTRGFGHSGN